MTEKAIFKKGSLFYSMSMCPSLQRDKNKVNKKYENKIQVLTTTIIGEQQQQNGDEIPPPLHRNILLLHKE
jgi:hypothetical protein